MQSKKLRSEICLRLYDINRYYPMFDVECDLWSWFCVMFVLFVWNWYTFLLDVAVLIFKYTKYDFCFIDLSLKMIITFVLYKIWFKDMN